MIVWTDSYARRYVTVHPIPSRPLLNGFPYG